MFNTLSISCLEIYFFFGLSMMELLLSFFLIINYYIIIIIEFFLKTKRFKLTSIVKEDLREFVMEDVEEVERLREMDLYSEPSSKLLSKKLKKKKIGKIYILLFFYKMLFYIYILIFLTKLVLFSK